MASIQQREKRQKIRKGFNKIKLSWNCAVKAHIEFFLFHTLSQMAKFLANNLSRRNDACTLMTDSFNREGFITTDKIYLNRVWLWSIETFIFLINEPFNKGTSFYAVHWSGKRESQSQRENVENAKISGYIAPVKKRIKEKLNQNI